MKGNFVGARGQKGADAGEEAREKQPIPVQVQRNNGAGFKKRPRTVCRSEKPNRPSKAQMTEGRELEEGWR